MMAIGLESFNRAGPGGPSSNELVDKWLWGLSKASPPEFNTSMVPGRNGVMWGMQVKF